MLQRPSAALLAALVYAASLAWLPPLQPPRLAVSIAQLFQLHSGQGVVAFVKALLLWVLLKLLGCIPLGALCVLVFDDQHDAQLRRRRVVLPASAFALGLSFAVAALQVGALPSIWAVSLCWIGGGVGVWIALSARRGPRARRLIVPKLAAATALLLLLAGVAVMLAIQSEPALAERPLPNSDQHRELVNLLRGRDPRKIPDGETRTLRLNQAQLDAALAWGSSLLRARSQAQLHDGGASAQLSIPFRAGRSWVNVTAASQLHVEGGELGFSDPELSIGRLYIPSFMLALAIRSTLSAIEADPDASMVLTALHELSLSPGELSMTYSAVRGRSGLAARLMLGEEVRDQLSASTLAQLTQLLAVLEPSQPGDQRFLRALQSVFQEAAARSSNTSAQIENRAALIALGIALGHPKLARILGERLDDALIRRLEALRDKTTLRGRNDWVRHFSVSAALTVLSAVAPSDAVGMLKEELDADGGSGFSFADLLADRSGTTLALRATESEQGAERAQARLSGVFEVDAVFADASGLPEGIQDAELKAQYGGVGGARFNELSSEIERRVAACPFLRP